MPRPLLRAESGLWTETASQAGTPTLTLWRSGLSLVLPFLLNLFVLFHKHCSILLLEWRVLSSQGCKYPVVSRPNDALHGAAGGAAAVGIADSAVRAVAADAIDDAAADVAAAAAAVAVAAAAGAGCLQSLATVLVHLHVLPASVMAAVGAAAGVGGAGCLQDGWADALRSLVGSRGSNRRSSDELCSCGTRLLAGPSRWVG